MTGLSWLTDKPFAHRGLHHAGKGIAENSLTAFRGAIAQGVGIELDVRATADGEAVVFHDVTLERLTGAPGAVATSTALGLKAHRLFGAHDDKIETLPGVLSVIRGQVPVLIEMKDCGAQNTRLCIAVRRALEGYSGAAGIMSFNPAFPKWFAKHAPGITRGLVTSDRGENYGLFAGTRYGHRRNMRAARAQFLAHDLLSLPSSFIRAMRGKGVPTLSWTVRSEADSQKARDNVDNVIFELETD
ncbi:MAG: glycerophosphodiester phosphodiesterase family protein [Pseudomonadota bacterium]